MDGWMDGWISIEPRRRKDTDHTLMVSPECQHPHPQVDSHQEVGFVACRGMQIPINLHVKMPNFAAEINIFTA